ncbi:MAG: hypothetical protein AAF743_12195, partial [Planctomycetota bacterium]
MRPKTVADFTHDDRVQRDRLASVQVDAADQLPHGGDAGVAEVRPAVVALSEARDRGDARVLGYGGERLGIVRIDSDGQ